MGKKLGERVAALIGQEIIASGAPPDTLLGREPELIERFACSRSVFREAVRLLEGQGIAEMRRGASGGLYVRRPEADPVVSAMAVYLDFNGVQPDQLEQARRAIETVCVESLAATITEPEVAQLREFLETEVENAESDEHQSMHDFHILIAQLTGNPALHLFVDSLTSLTTRQRPARPYLNEYLRDTHRAHAKIADAIVGRDPALARHRMVSHLDAVARFWSPRGGTAGSSDRQSA